MRNTVLALLLFLITAACGAGAWALFDTKPQFIPQENYAQTLQSRADNGDARAMYELGVFYMHGVDMPANNDKALKWLKRAYDNGEVKAFLVTSNLLESTEQFEALKEWYEIIAIKGDKNAAYNLANMYYIGEHTPQDYNEARKWYKFAADKDHTMAQYWYAVSTVKVTEGITSNDYMIAGEYLGMAAEKGYPHAQNALSYYEQECVKYEKKWNIRKYIYSCLLAIHSDNGAVNYAVGYAFVNGWYNLRKTTKDGFLHLEKAAQSGNLKAQMKLSELYENGKGTDKSLIQAYAWHSVALENIIANKNVIDFKAFIIGKLIARESELALQMPEADQAQAVALKQEYIEKYSAGSK
ncbi:MAG: tetratricopeptide repeat protein [Alcanivorax sp.]